MVEKKGKNQKGSLKMKELLKKLTSAFLAVVIAVTSLPFVTANVEATDRTVSDVVSWIKARADEGWNVDVDGAYGCQCVDLIYAYYEYLGYARCGGSAYQYAYGSFGIPSGSGWYKDTTPSPGAIIVWPGNVWTGQWTTSDAGHVGLVYAVEGSTVYTVETNLSAPYNGGPARYCTRYPQNAIYIHPDFPGTTPPPPIKYSTITPGTYFLINKYDGKALTLANNEDWNTNNVHGYQASWTNRGQQMVITEAPDGYKIRPLDSTRLVQPYGDHVFEGANVNIYDDVNDSSQWWKFEKTDGGYFIRNTQNTNLILTNSFPNDGNTVIWSYAGGSDQIWELVPAQLPSKPVVKGMKSTYTTSENITVQWDGDGYNTNMYAAILFKKVNGTYNQVLLKNDISQGYSLNSDYTFEEGEYKLNVIGANTNLLIEYGGYYMNTFSDAFTFSVKKSSSGNASALKATGTNAAVGGNLTISLSIDKTKLSGLDFDLIYDSSKLKFIGTSNAAFENEQINEITTGKIKAAYYSSDSAYTGKLVDLKFEVIAKNEGTADIMINPTMAMNENNTVIELNPTSYTAIISSSFMLGDVDNDGKISSRDARLAHRAAVGLEGLTPAQFSAADADKDGRITSRDARLIHRAAVGLEKLS
ncbi:MAG TPA: hypothetical protein DDX91_07645 [Ruminococcaceae bacterium]|nr:hypothetical protein [Oscillospiraceae bacterium]